MNATVETSKRVRGRSTFPKGRPAEILGFRLSRKLACEFLGTMSLVLSGAGIVAFTSLDAVPYSLLVIASTFGVVVALVVMAAGRISGAHIDPAVSLASALAGRLRRDLLLPYIFFQVLGGLLAGVILRSLFPASQESRFLGSTLLSPSIPPVAGVLIEMTGTFLLSTVALSVSSRVRRLPFQAILVGTTLFILILVMAPYTSASLNPARSIGPALASGHVEGLEVYLVGPLSGGAIAGLLARWKSQRGKTPVCLL